MGQQSRIDKFDDVLFRRFVEKVMIQSMAELAFVLKVGVEAAMIKPSQRQVPRFACGVSGWWPFYLESVWEYDGIGEKVEIISKTYL